MRRIWFATIRLYGMVAFLFVFSDAHATVRATRSMAVLQQNSDLVVVAAVQNIVSANDGQQTISLQILRTIKGNPASTSVSAVLAPRLTRGLCFQQVCYRML